MEEYDPLKAPDPEEWLKMDDSKRLFMIEEYHEKMNFGIEGLQLHAIVHQIVENQLAENLPDVVDTLERLQYQGLDRHEAIHAIGSVLLEFLWDIIKEGREFSEISAQEAYLRELRKLTKRSWYKKARKRE